MDSARPPLSGLLQLQYYLSVYTVSATLKSCTLSKSALYMYIFQGLVCQWLERREDMEQGEFHSNVKEVLSWMSTHTRDLISNAEKADEVATVANSCSWGCLVC